MNKKLLEWINRYLPAEILATVGAVLGAGIVFMYTHKHILSAYSGVLVENLFYFLFIFIREHRADFLKTKKSKESYWPVGVLKTWRNLSVEFGFSGILSFFVVRPFFLLMFPIWIGNFVLGTIVGKLTSDVLFYSITITAYEMRKRIFR